MNKSKIRIFVNPYNRKPWQPCFYSLESMLQEIYIKNTRYKQKYY